MSMDGAAVAALIIVFAAVFLVQDAAIRASGEEAWGADGEAAELIESTGYEPGSSPSGSPERRDRVVLLPCRQPSARWSSDIRSATGRAAGRLPDGIGDPANLMGGDCNAHDTR